MYSSLDDDGDVLAASPDRLYEVRPQGRVLRRTVEQNVDAVTFPSLDVPEPQMGNQLVEVLQKIDTRSLHQVTEVPKIFPVSVPQRFVESRPPQLAEQLVEVPTDPAYVLLVLASKVYSRREVRALSVWVPGRRQSISSGSWRGRCTWRSSRFSRKTELNSEFGADR